MLKLCSQTSIDHSVQQAGDQNPKYISSKNEEKKGKVSHNSVFSNQPALRYWHSIKNILKATEPYSSVWYCRSCKHTLTNLCLLSNRCHRRQLVCSLETLQLFRGNCDRLLRSPATAAESKHSPGASAPSQCYGVEGWEKGGVGFPLRPPAACFQPAAVCLPQTSKSESRAFCLLFDSLVFSSKTCRAPAKKTKKKTCHQKKNLFGIPTHNS